MAETAKARQRLAAFDTHYLSNAWHHLLCTTLHSLDACPDPTRAPSGLRQVTNSHD